MVQLFQKYTGKYDFDYLMIGAQACRESGLDHSKRSHAGAVGVMQVLPATVVGITAINPQFIRHELRIGLHLQTHNVSFDK